MRSRDLRPWLISGVPLGRGRAENYVALTGLGIFGGWEPGALPRAVLWRSVGAL